MRALLILFLILASAWPAAAAGRSVTYYLDGARVEGELSAVKGYVEVPLPGDLVHGSFRVRPGGGSSVVRVEIEPARTVQKVEKELKALTERRKSLEDRLRALEVREEIFKSAAKSQSSKAPRRTKNNPEPLDTIRKGTDFAVAQLEEVYRARRRAEEGVKGVDERLAALRKEGRIDGSVARVWLAGKGRASYTFLVKGDGWTPFYDFRLDDRGEVEVTLRAIVPRAEKGRAAVVPLRLAEAASESRVLPVGEDFGAAARYTLPVERKEPISTLQRGVVFSFRNSSGERLVGGEGACYLNGEFLGKVRMDGSAPGEVREIAVGK
jgi:hypothetical protein